MMEYFKLTGFGAPRARARTHAQTNSVAFSPQVNNTDRAAAAGEQS
jgi:hypothetical protein